MGIDIEKHNQMIREIAKKFYNKDMIGRNKDTREDSLIIYKDENDVKKFYRKSNGEYLEIDNNTHSINGEILLKIDDLEEKQVRGSIINEKFVGKHILNAKGEIIEEIKLDKREYIVINKISKKLEKEENSL